MTQETVVEGGVIDGKGELVEEADEEELLWDLQSEDEELAETEAEDGGDGDAMVVDLGEREDGETPPDCGGFQTATRPWAGHQFGPGVTAQGIVLMMGNVRRLPTGKDTYEQGKLWRAMAGRRVDFCGVIDHGLEVNTATKAGELCPHKSSGQALGQAKQWGAEGMKWVVGTGMKGARGTTAEGKLEGGTLLAATVQWRGFTGQNFTDRRGWGRYAGMVIAGGKRWRRQVVLVACYCPSPGTATWKRQERMLSENRATTEGIEANPRSQFYRDVYDQLGKFRQSLRMRTAYIFMGDFNEEFNEGRRLGSLFGGIVEFAQVMGLEDAMLARHGGAHRQRRFWTRKEGGAVSCPDHILVSRCLATQDAVRRVGVWQDATMLGSDHRMMGMEVECSRWLGVTARRQRLPKPATRLREPVLYLNDVEKVMRYKIRVMEEFMERGMIKKVEAVQMEMRSRASRGVEFGVDEAQLQEAMDLLDFSFWTMLKECKDDVAGRPVRTDKKMRSAIKGPSSPAQKKVGRQIREIDRMRHLVWANKGAAKKKAAAFVKRYKAKWLGVPDMRWDDTEWWRFEFRLEGKARELKKVHNAAWREQQREKIQKNRKWVRQAHKEKKIRQLMRGVRKARPAALDRDSMEVGQGEEARVVHEAEELGAELRNFFAQWFKEGQDSWFQHWENGVVVWTHLLFRNDSDGWDARERVVEGFSEEETSAEFLAFLHLEIYPGIPEECRWVLSLYGRKYSPVVKRRARQDDYSNRGVMQEITEDMHDAYWTKKSANKAVDAMGVNANLVKALCKAVKVEVDGEEHEVVVTWEVYEVVRFMLNVVVATGMVYTSWATEILLTAPKVQGSAKMVDVRPLGILMLLRNAFFGIQYRGVKQTWDDLQLVATNQYAAQRGIGTTEFRFMEMVVYEDVYIFDKDIGAGNEDKEKAYDLVSVTVGYSMGMKRLAVVDTLLKVDLKVTRMGHIMVRFSFGYSPKIYKTGFGSCGFGCAQGSEDGPDKYVAYEDALNTWWARQDMGVWVFVSEWHRIQLKGGAFMDDKKPMGLAEHLARWYMASSLSCLFHDTRIKAAKSATHFKVGTDDGRVMRACNLEKIVIRTTQGEEALQMLEADEALKTLGGHTTPVLCWKEQHRVIAKVAEETALMLTAGVDRGTAKLYWERSFERAVIYKALMMETTEGRFYDILKPAWIKYKQKMGLARSTPKLAAYACGIGDVWSGLMVERLMALLRSLNSNRDHVRHVAQTMLFLEQRWGGSAVPCLEQDFCELRGRSGTWVGDLRQWMTKVGIKVEGGSCLAGLREGDAAIVDLVEEREKGVVAAGLWCLQVWRLSEMFNRVGSVRVQWSNGYWRERLECEIEGKTVEERKDAAHRCEAAVRRVMARYSGWGKELGDWKREAFRLGQYVGFMDDEEGFTVGWINDMEREMGWQDRVLVFPLVEVGVEEEDLWPMMTNVWDREPWKQVWARPDTVGMRAEKREMRVEELVAIQTLRLKCRRGADEIVVVVVDEEEDEVLGHRVELTWWLTGNCAGEEVGEQWHFEGIESLIGWYDEGAAQRQFGVALGGRVGKELEGLVLLLYSDGSFMDAGIGSRASYGWQVWGFEGEGEMDGIVGGGIVHGDPTLLDSTRAEHHGGLAVLIAAHRLGWRGRVRLGLDNAGVTARMEGKSEKGKRWLDEEVAETPKQWLKMKDPDVHAEAEAWEGRFEEVVWVWYRGHPEKRKQVAQYSRHDRANVLCDKIAGQQYERWPAESLRLDWWVFSHQPKWKVFCQGEELQGKIRQRLVQHARAMRMQEFMAHKEGNGDYAKEEAVRPEGEGREGTVEGRKVLLREKAFSEMRKEWVYPGLLMPMLNKFKDVGEQVIAVKVIAEMLATEASAAHRGSGGEVWPCRLCGCEGGGGETNFHVLWRCTHSDAVVTARDEMASKVWDILEAHKVPARDHVVAAAFVWLRDGAVVLSKAEELLAVMEETVARPEAVEMVMRATEGMRGKGLDWARKGSMGAGWVDALIAMGTPRGHAIEAVKAINLEVRRGATRVWKEFTKQVHGGEDEGKRHEMEVTDELLREVFDGEVRGDLIQIGRMVAAWPFSKRAKWMKQYVFLEERVGRIAAIERARCLAERPAGSHRMTIEVRWKEALLHARRKGGTADQDLAPPPVLQMMMHTSFRRHQVDRGVLAKGGAAPTKEDDKECAAFSKRLREEKGGGSKAKVAKHAGRKKGARKGGAMVSSGQTSNEEFKNKFGKRTAGRNPVGTAAEQVGGSSRYPGGQVRGDEDRAGGRRGVTRPRQGGSTDWQLSPGGDSQGEAVGGRPRHPGGKGWGEEEDAGGRRGAARVRQGGSADRQLPPGGDSLGELRSTGEWSTAPHWGVLAQDWTGGAGSKSGAGNKTDPNVERELDAGGDGVGDGSEFRVESEGARRGEERGGEDIDEEAADGARGKRWSHDGECEEDGATQDDAGFDREVGSQLGRHRLGMGGGTADPGGPVAALEEETRYGEAPRRTLADTGCDEGGLDLLLEGEDVEGRGGSPASSRSSDGMPRGEASARDVRANRRARRKRRYVRIASDSEGDGGGVAGTEEWVQGIGGEEGFLGGCRGLDVAREGRGGCGEEPDRGRLGGVSEASDWDRSCDKEEDGVNRRSEVDSGLPRPRSSDTELEEGGRGQRAVLCGAGHKGVGLLCEGEDLGAELCLRLHSDEPCGVVGGGAEAGEGRYRVGGEDCADYGVGLSPMSYLHDHRSDQSGEGVQLQGPHSAAQATDQGKLEVCERSSQVRLSGAAYAEDYGDGSRDGGSLGDREPSGEPEVQTLHGDYEAAAQDGGGGLLCLRGGVQKAHQPVDEPGLEAAGDPRMPRRKVLECLSRGELGAEGQVGTQVQDCPRQLGGSRGAWQEGHEGGGSCDAPQGDAGEPELQAVKEGVGRVRGRKRKAYSEEHKRLKRKAGTDEMLMLNLVSVDASTPEKEVSRKRICRVEQDGEEAMSNLLPD